MSPWLARRWYDSIFWSSFFGFTFGHSLRVCGRRHMPEAGPVLLLANHQSFFDPVLVGLASRRYLSYLARRSLFKGFFKTVIESLDAIPIDHKGLGKDGLQATLKVLKKGKAVLVFPEGERTPDGAMHPFKPGISLLISRLECPIVPVGICGAFHAWPRQNRLPSLAPLLLPARPANIAISVGKPIPPATLAGLERDQVLARLFEAVAAEFARANRLQRKAHCLQR
jgi:1-acyl-sn-glycerol-3-phosphate acyltransferase